MMYEREGKGTGAAFDRGYRHSAVPEPQPRDRSPEEKSAGARTIADNFDVQLELVRAGAAAMEAAAAAGDLAGWTEANTNADQALKHLAHIAQLAPAAARDGADVDVRKRLATAEQALDGARRLVAEAPAAPRPAAPELSCADALLGVLPSDPPPAAWRDADFHAAADAVEAVCTRQMTTSDIAAFRAIVTHHDDHVIARRFYRFGAVRRRGLLELLDKNDVRRAARARETVRRADAAGRAAQSGAHATTKLVSVDVTSTVSQVADARTANPAEAPAMPQRIASDGAAEPTAREQPELREALGSAIAAQVPGVTYEGTGRFFVTMHERRVEASIRRVHTGVSRVRHDAGNMVVLEIPVGLSDGELATAVAAQLRALQLQRGAQPGSGSPTSGGPLPPDVRADMESSLGAELSSVRIHQDGEAEEVGALAFTRGADIHFAPGHYDPHGTPGRQLLGHELAHVAQQAQGRVSATTQINGQATNDDPALEQEADSKGTLAAAAIGGATAPTPARRGAVGPVEANAAPPTPDTSTGAQPMSDVAAFATDAPIQRQQDEHKPKKPRIPYRIQITRPMTGDEFKVAAHLQVFGAVIASDWRSVKDAYTPADSPVEILVDVELFHRGRGLANAARGIETDATGAVAGGEDRARDFQGAPASDEKTALLAEIDGRYYAASGAAADSKIKPGEVGRAELWRTIRDEVLFQGAYLANLPEKVRAVIRVSIAGRELAPTDYDQLFRVAKKIENLPPGQAADYASKVTGQAANLADLEAAIEHYRGGVAVREHQNQERAEVHNKLLGLEEVYRLYRAYRATPAEAMAPGAREQLEQQLGRYGFASVGKFTSYVAKYEQSFEDGAAAITLDILAKYAGKLHRESQRYQDREVVKALHGKLGGFRAQHEAFDKNSKIYSAEVWKAQHERNAEVRRLPGNGGTPEQPPTRERVEAKQKAEAAKASAEAQIKDLSKDYPIFAEDELPTDKRLDKVALAQASEDELAGVLQAHIAHRQTAVADARAHLEGKHELIYKMPKLMPTFYGQLGIQAGSIHDQIIQDKMHGDAVAKVVTGVIVAIVTVALTVVSLGTATPAVLAAGASIGAAGISTYMAYDEYKQYTEDHAIAETGFANDPSVTWLVLAIVGAGADMASAVTVISKLAPAAKALGTDGKLIDFTNAVEALRRSQEIDAKIAAAADKAAAARTSYSAAKEQFKADLKVAASGTRGALGPFTDPSVFRGLVKMAIAKLREGMHSLEVFIEQLKKARIEAKLGEMSPEELVKAKEAWAQAEALQRQVKDPAVLDLLLELHLDPTALEKFAGLDVTALKKFVALEPEVLQKFARLRYADMLAKFGACDAEGLAKLATLDRSVLEKLGGWDARTVDNISRLPMPDIEKVAHLKVAPGQAVEGALGSFRSEQFHMGSEVFQLDKSGMMHILERHHPQYWDGSVKLKQSFLDPRMSLDEIQDAIRAVMQQNREQLIKLGTNVQFQVTGTYGGSTYVLGITKGRVAQFYPKVR